MTVILTDNDDVMETEVTEVKIDRCTKKGLRAEKAELQEMKTKINARIDVVTAQIDLINAEIAAGRAQDRRTPPTP